MASSHNEFKSSAPNLTFTATQFEIAEALTMLINCDCRESFKGIKTNENDFVIFSNHNTHDKYKIRDRYIRDTLHIPFTNVEGKYYFHIARQDALANPDVQNKISENRNIKIAAFLNVFFPLSDVNSWGIQKNQIAFVSPNPNYTWVGDPRLPEIMASLPNLGSFIDSDLTSSLGFDASFVENIKNKISIESHKSGVFRYFKKEDAHILHPILKMISLMESALETKLAMHDKDAKISVEQTTLNLK